MAAATAARGDAALDVLDDAEEDVGGGEGIARDVGECDAVPFLRRRQSEPTATWRTPVMLEVKLSTSCTLSMMFTVVA